MMEKNGFEIITLGFADFDVKCRKCSAVIQVQFKTYAALHSCKCGHTFYVKFE